MTTYTNEQILNKGCQVEFNGNLYYCYNVTSLMHFVKCGKNEQPLKVNKNNALNITRETVLNFIDKGIANVKVGSITK
jgi:hypothetical protein